MCISNTVRRRSLNLNVEVLSGVASAAAKTQGRANSGPSRATAKWQASTPPPPPRSCAPLAAPGPLSIPMTLSTKPNQIETPPAQTQTPQLSAHLASTARMPPGPGTRQINPVSPPGQARAQAQGVQTVQDRRNKHDLHVDHTYQDHAFELTTNEKHITRGGVTEPFPLKLHRMLDQIELDGYGSIVGWQSHGRCFVVHRPREFVEIVMPKYFKQTKFASFQRQLNLYGFSRITAGLDRGGYYHELFLRGKDFLTHRIHRMRVKGTKVRMASSPDQEPNFYTMTPLGCDGLRSVGSETPQASTIGQMPPPPPLYRPVDQGNTQLRLQPQATACMVPSNLAVQAQQLSPLSTPQATKAQQPNAATLNPASPSQPQQSHTQQGTLNPLLSVSSDHQIKQQSQNTSRSRASMSSRFIQPTQIAPRPVMPLPIYQHSQWQQSQQLQQYALCPENNAQVPTSPTWTSNPMQTCKPQSPSLPTQTCDRQELATQTNNIPLHIQTCEQPEPCSQIDTVPSYEDEYEFDDDNLDEVVFEGQVFHYLKPFKDSPKNQLSATNTSAIERSPAYKKNKQHMGRQSQHLMSHTSPSQPQTDSWSSQSSIIPTSPVYSSIPTAPRTPPPPLELSTPLVGSKMIPPQAFEVASQLAEIVHKKNVSPSEICHSQDVLSHFQSKVQPEPAYSGVAEKLNDSKGLFFSVSEAPEGEPEDNAVVSDDEHNGSVADQLQRSLPSDTTLSDQAQHDITVHNERIDKDDGYTSKDDERERDTLVKKVNEEMESFFATLDAPLEFDEDMSDCLADDIGFGYMLEKVLD